MQTAASPSSSVPTTATDRRLAGAAHVTSLLGPWVILPFILYMFQRERSRFVAHHAMRAIVLQLAFVIACLTGMALGTSTLTTLMFLPEFFVQLMLYQMYAFVGFLVLIYVALILIAMVRAFSGQTDTGSLFARASDAVLERDARVSQA